MPTESSSSELVQLVVAREPLPARVLGFILGLLAGTVDWSSSAVLWAELPDGHRYGLTGRIFLAQANIRADEYRSRIKEIGAAGWADEIGNEALGRAIRGLGGPRGSQQS